MTGIIIKNISNSYTVKTTTSSYTCTPCGKLRNQKKIPLVGDEVIFDELNKSKLIELCDLYSSKTLHILKKYLEDNNDK